MRILFLVLIVSIANIVCGQFAPHVGETGSKAVKNTSKSVIGWATSCSVQRGWMDIADTSLGKTSFGSEADAVGSSNPAVVSLGDGGIATLTFDEPIYNREGFDFAVFENSFDDYFLELAHVEVSTDGINYVRFPSFSNTQTSTQVMPFGTLDAHNIYNLAGKYRGQYGTPFDLEELKDSLKINIDSINYVRVIDVVGSINSQFGSFDSEGNIINDPYPTDFENGGFDLDAVAVLDMSLVTSLEDDFISEIKIYPNPATNGDIVYVSEKGVLLNYLGQIVKNIESNQFKINVLESGIYFFKSKNNIIQTLIVR